ncbi:MAG: hypothetical protein HY691_10735, partial [Chloroflexi bacterium]|nr:hypothetical protein [Chloroflexota bacterium]
QCGFQDNQAKGLPLIMGLVILYDPQTGEPQVILDSATVTAIRTAAASAMATKHRARAGKEGAAEAFPSRPSLVHNGAAERGDQR